MKSSTCGILHLLMVVYGSKCQHWTCSLLRMRTKRNVAAYFLIIITKFPAVLKFQPMKFLFLICWLADEPAEPTLSPLLRVQQENCSPLFLTSNGRKGPNRIVILQPLALSNIEPKWQVPVIVSWFKVGFIAWQPQCISRSLLLSPLWVARALAGVRHAQPGIWAVEWK